jgi:low temperature requirement protein LtrA
MPRRARLPRLSAELRERETVRPLELFFDLVFVLVFTQCTALMADHPTWTGVGQGMLVLAMLWWAWAAYAWLTSVVDPEEGAVRIALIAVMAALLVAALCVPQAFNDRALAFAVTYGIVRTGHIALFVLASRDNDELRRSVGVIALATAVAVGLLFGAAALDGEAQAALWAVAILVDWGLPGLFGAAGWRLVPAHFAERHNLIIILALGESIVALGAGAEVDLSAGLYAAAVLGITLASAIWWTYFDVVALVTERRLVQAVPGVPQNTLARDSYSYLHFPMVAGIILLSLGLKKTLLDVDHPLKTVPAFALLGGVAIYLLAHVVLRLRNARTLNRQRLGVAVLLLALWPLAGEVSALAALAIVNAVIWAMVIYEMSTYDERRYKLRHGLEIETPGG